ncbi:hypothetical protein SteCoe_5255 [Stentor coeruleus]|uniref:Uncharacterized protein n=1 Tax=Stentor coeruleus TaxID=5963 RepID=A0A1R2CSS5_9CILI|nr:hypothetical protein SteCoe_5255 [Stentor coeruleus]
MAEKGSKIVLDVVKGLEKRIIKLEKELKSQQEIVKKLVICITELSNIVKKIPDKQIRKSMAFKYPFPSQEINLDLTHLDLEDTKPKILSISRELEQLSELTVTDSEDFSLSFETVEILDSLCASG